MPRLILIVLLLTTACDDAPCPQGSTASGNRCEPNTSAG
jgi:hypothetical protein